MPRYTRHPRPHAIALFLALTVGASCPSAAPRKDTDEAAHWTKTHAVTIATVEAGNGFEDLQPLSRSLREAECVALGEATHGSHEIFQLKHRLVEYLATELGFTRFAIEANMPEAQRLDAYVRGADGDPAELVRGMQFWTWSTREVLAMVEWMRRFNLDRTHRDAGRQIGFTGFDIQSPETAAHEVWLFVDAHFPDLRSQFDSANASLAAIRAATDDFGSIHANLPIETLRGRRLTLSGWIRTAGIRNGWAGLWLRADTGEEYGTAFDNMLATGPRGTTDWQRHSTTITVPQQATAVTFGAIMSGQGSAWFDDFEIRVDDKPFPSAADLPLDFEGDFLPRYKSSNTESHPASRSTIAHSGTGGLQIECEDPAQSNKSKKNALRLWRAFETALRDRGALDRVDAESIAWALQYSHLIVQYLQMELGQKPRDQSMAENVLWLRDRYPREKLILWAHNAHISREGERMGSVLADTLGDKYRPIAITTGQGTYTAWSASGRGLAALPLATPPEDSIEAVCATTGVGAIALVLRPGQPGAGKLPAWFRKTRPHRQIGSGELSGPRQFASCNLPVAFDLLFWIRESRASELLPPAP